MALASIHQIKVQNNLLNLLEEENNSLKKQLSQANKQIHKLQHQIHNLQQQLKQYMDNGRSLSISQPKQSLIIKDMIQNHEKTRSKNFIDIGMQHHNQQFNQISIKKLKPKKYKQTNIEPFRNKSKTAAVNFYRQFSTEEVNKIAQDQTVRHKIFGNRAQKNRNKSNQSDFLSNNLCNSIQFEKKASNVGTNNQSKVLIPQTSFKIKSKRLQRAICPISIKQSVKLLQNSLHVAEKARSKRHSKIFQMRNQSEQKIKNPKNPNKIFDTFFVTGFSITPQSIVPKILYYYPNTSAHFPAILDLIFGDTSLQIAEKDNNLLTTQLKFKDYFILPLKKEGSEGKELQYLCVYQTQQFLHDENNNIYIIPRMYCFIIQWKFFNELKQLTDQLVKIIHSKRKSISKKLTQFQLKLLIKQQLENPLKRLAYKTIERNQLINISQSQNIKLLIDIPSQEQSYKMITQFRQWEILEKKANIRNLAQDIIEVSLLSVLVIYMLTEHKIILYSTIKSKISQALLNCLQIIKPLQYVNPIVVGAYKDSFQQYIEAPIPLILGAWHQQANQEQKQEIFVTTKLNMVTLIKNGRLTIQDGIVFNLDTGLVFGGAINIQLNSIVQQLDRLLSCNNSTRFDQYEHFKIFNKIIHSKQRAGDQFYRFWQKLQTRIMNTQSYCYFKQQFSHNN